MKRLPLYIRKKSAKQLISAVLSVVLILTFLPLNALAEDVVNAADISIGTSAPVNGANITDGTITFGSGTVADVKWSSDGITYAAAAGSFAQSTLYQTKYVFTADTNHVFDPTPGAYVKGGERDLSSRITNLGTGTFTAEVSQGFTLNDTLTVVISWPNATIEAADISIGTAAPLTDAVIENGTNTFNHGSADITWSSTGSSFGPASGNFAPGTIYYTQYLITTDSGYAFDNTNRIYQNGSKNVSSRIAHIGTGEIVRATVSTTTHANDTLTLIVMWESTKKATGQAVIGPSDLTIGTAAPAPSAVVADGSNEFKRGKVDYAEWYTSNNSQELHPGDSFISGTTYRTGYHLIAASGYAFDTPSAYQKGGARDLTSRITNLGSGTFNISSPDGDDLYIDVYWPKTGEISPADMMIGTDAPVAEADMTNGTNMFKHASSSIAWSSDNGATYQTASGTYAFETTYKTKYIIEATAGYFFDPTAGVYASGGSKSLNNSITNLGSGTYTAVVSGTANNTLTIEVTWPRTTGAVQSKIDASGIAVGTAAPVTGASMTNGTNTFVHASSAITWSADQGITYTAASGTFAPGTSYRTKYVLTADTGYIFDAAAGAYKGVSVANLGKGEFKAEVSTTSTANDTMTITVTWPATSNATIAVSDLVIGTPAPAAGEIITDGSNTWTNTQTSITWSSDNGAHYMSASGSFAPNTSYQTKYVLTAASGYQFDTAADAYHSIAVTHIGSGTFSVQVSTVTNTNDTLTIIVSWQATGTATITAADLLIDTSTPLTNASQTNGTNQFNHAVANVTWSADGGQTYSIAQGTFEAATIYKTRYVIKAAAGFTFDASTGVYNQNGARDLTSRITNLGTGTFTASVSTTDSSNDTLIVIVTWPSTSSAIIQPEDIVIGTAAPVTGAAQTNGSNVFNKSTASITWSADHGSTFQPASGTFAIGKVYQTKYVLTALSGYQFDRSIGGYSSISIANRGTGTFTVQVSTTSLPDDTLTIIVTWPQTSLADTVKVSLNDASNIRAYSGSTPIAAQGISLPAAEDYSIILVNTSMNTLEPSAPQTAAMVKSVKVTDSQGNNVLKSVRAVSNGVAQNHPWSLEITINKNETSIARNIMVNVEVDTALRIDIRNLVGFTKPGVEYADKGNEREQYPYEYGNYYYFLPGDALLMQTQSSGLIPAGVQIVGAKTSRTAAITNTLFDTINYQFRYTFTMPDEPVFLSVTSTDGKAAHDIKVSATIQNVVVPALSGGATFVPTTASKPAMDHSGDIVTVDPGSYDQRMYKVTGVEVRSELLNVVLPVTKNGDGTYSFVMPFTHAIVTVVVERVTSNLVQTEVKKNNSAQVITNPEQYYAGDSLKLQITNTDPTKYVSSIQIWRVVDDLLTLVKQGKPVNPYASKMDFDIKPYASNVPLIDGAKLKAVVNYEDISIPVTTESPAQFSNVPAKVKFNESITFTFAPPGDNSKVYKPEVKFRDALQPDMTSVLACTFVRTDAQDQTRSEYTCPAVTKSSTASVELLYDSVNVASTVGAAKIKRMASISPNSRLAGTFNSIMVSGTDMNGRGDVYLGTSPDPVDKANVTQTTSGSLVISIPASLLSRTKDVTYYVSINGVQRSVTIATAQNLVHSSFGNMAIVSDKTFNHSVIVAQSEKELEQQLGNREAVVTLKGKFKISETAAGEYNFEGTTIINGGVTSYLPTSQSSFNVKDDGDGSVKIMMKRVNLVAGAFSLITSSDGSIELEKGIEYIKDYAKDDDGELLDENQQNVEISFDKHNQLTVLGSGMTAQITGASLLGNKMVFDGKVYLGMALPGSGNMGFGLQIDRLQYGADGQGSLNFQGVKADGYFTPGNDMSKKLLGGFGVGASAEGSIDTFKEEYGLAFDIDAKLANFAAEMGLKRNSTNGKFIPDTIKIVVGLSEGIPITPAMPIAQLTRVGGGVTGLADTITGNYKGIAPILILINGDLEVGSLLPGHGLLEFNDVELAIGPSQISLSGNPTLMKMEIFDQFKAGIYVTNTSVSYQMQVAANILKNFSVILAGGNANLTYSRDGSSNLNGQLHGRLQVPKVDVGIFSLGPYTITDSDIGLSKTNAYATFHVLGFGMKVNYAFGSNAVSVGRLALRSLPNSQPEQGRESGKTVYDENGVAVGQMNTFSNIKEVASSQAQISLKTPNLTPSIITNDAGDVHTVSFPAGMMDDYAVLVSANPKDISIMDPQGNPYGLTYAGTLKDGTTFYNDPNANALVVSDDTVMIRLSALTGDWTISSSKPFFSSVIDVQPIPEIADVQYDAGSRNVSWDLKGLDTEKENYRVEVRLSTDNGDDRTQTTAGVLVHTLDVNETQVTDGVAAGNYSFTTQDLNYLQNGKYFPRLTLVGVPKSETSNTIPYASLNAKQPMDVINPLTPDAVREVLAVSGGSGTIHATWSAVSAADGYLVRLLDAEGNAVMSPLSYTDELSSDGKATGKKIAHAGQPIEYQVQADNAVNGKVDLDFGGMEPGASYQLAVIPYAKADSSPSNTSYIYGASTMTSLVYVPQVKAPVIHVASSQGLMTSDALTGNLLTVNGDFNLEAAATYVNPEDGQSKELPAKFTVWQSDGTLDEQTNLPKFHPIYASTQVERQISVPVALDGEAGSSLIRIVAENEQGDVSEYGLGVHFNRLPPALFVETDKNASVTTDTAGRYQVQGSTVSYASVRDSLGNQTTADAEGRFSIKGTLNTAAKAVVTFTAVDHVGNFAQDDITIVRDYTPANPGNGNPTDSGGHTGGQTGGGQTHSEPSVTSGSSGSSPQDHGSTGAGQEGNSGNEGGPPHSSFRDVQSEAPWAAEVIERAYAKGIVSGIKPGIFAPNLNTRRDEVIAMLVRAKQLNVGIQADMEASAAYFTDWNELSAWSKPYIAAAYANGLISGLTKNGKHYILGGTYVTRAEAAVLFQNAYHLSADASGRKVYTDNIPSWAAESVDILSSHGIINGYLNSTFRAGAKATRAEIVVMLMRLIERN
ncbi:S-layer homology domain-containing protein [Paenibacillus silvae]|uniref:SLH domain-containing protein n=1 Tax=Paenibacillus silvae TaxID=1325358 RepID=A0A2W6NBT4_9BACL|nr:S-layer homology domain-containing protein [Paenibacillus silvae]PZT53467.1 hypothetical protein DN757_22495 [Paenibacillus silvae]